MTGLPSRASAVRASARWPWCSGLNAPDSTATPSAAPSGTIVCGPYATSLSTEPSSSRSSGRRTSRRVMASSSPGLMSMAIPPTPAATASAYSISWLTTASSPARSRAPFSITSEVTVTCSPSHSATWQRCSPRLGRSVVMVAVQASPSVGPSPSRKRTARAWAAAAMPTAASTETNCSGSQPR